MVNKRIVAIHSGIKEESLGKKIAMKIAFKTFDSKKHNISIVSEGTMNPMMMVNGVPYAMSREQVKETLPSENFQYFTKTIEIKIEKR